LSSTVLRSAHHGSKSFFWEGDPEKEDAYTAHLDFINPEYIIVSAPKKSESKHEHPDDQAMELYEDKVGKSKVYHLGKKRECIIVDIDEEGNLNLFVDDILVKEYAISEKVEENQGDKVSYEKPRNSAVVFPGRYGSV